MGFPTCSHSFPRFAFLSVGFFLGAGAQTDVDTGPDGVHPRLKGELFQSMVEVITGVCETVSEARRDLDASIEVTIARALSVRNGSVTSRSCVLLPEAMSYRYTVIGAVNDVKL